jgi:hypothetical protein
MMHNVDERLVERACGGSYTTGFLIKTIADRICFDKRAREALWEEVAAVTESLAGPDPTPAERLLARSAALEWLAQTCYELQYQALLKSGSSLHIEMSEHYQRRLSRVQRRYLAAVRMLATVRKLALPSIKVVAVQANVALSQINGVPAAALEPPP